MGKKSKETKLVQRSKLWDNEVYMNQASTTTKTKITLEYGDRFIPRRLFLINNEHNQKFATENDINDILQMGSTENYRRQDYFKLILNHECNIKTHRILQFTDHLVENGKKNINSDTCDWYCRPRRKPFAFVESVHNLPAGFNAFVGISFIHLDHNLGDWSSNGQIAVCYGNDVMVWKDQGDITMVFTVTESRSLAYSPNGKFLAIGCKTYGFPVLELWEFNSSNNHFMVVNGKVFSRQQSAVLCIEWAKCGNQIVCGTSLGTIHVLSIPNLNIIRKINTSKSSITILKFSPTMRYLASGDAAGNVIVYEWHYYKALCFIRPNRKLTVIFDWHPWNGVDLVIAQDLPAYISILHVPSRKIEAFYARNDSKIAINYVTFSKMTGELLVSISYRDGHSLVSSKILVMSSLNRVVDILQIPLNDARFIMWNSSGSKMASAGSDETLLIWNFYPEYKMNKIQRNRFIKSRDVKNLKRNISENFYGSQFTKWSCIK